MKTSRSSKTKVIAKSDEHPTEFMVFSKPEYFAVVLPKYERCLPPSLRRTPIPIKAAFRNYDGSVSALLDVTPNIAVHTNKCLVLPPSVKNNASLSTFPADGKIISYWHCGREKDHKSRGDCCGSEEAFSAGCATLEWCDKYLYRQHDIPLTTHTIFADNLSSRADMDSRGQWRDSSPSNLSFIPMARVRQRGQPDVYDAMVSAFLTARDDGIYGRITYLRTGDGVPMVPRHSKILFVPESGKFFFLKKNHYGGHVNLTFSTGVEELEIVGHAGSFTEERTLLTASMDALVRRSAIACCPDTMKMLP